MASDPWKREHTQTDVSIITFRRTFEHYTLNKHTTKQDPKSTCEELLNKAADKTDKIVHYSVCSL